MMSDESVKQLFMEARRVLQKNPVDNKKLHTQIFRGMTADNWEGQPSGNCTRHKLIFDRFKIIPKYCFSCYKVVIRPATVLELFKLMMVLERFEFPNDNTRKCFVEVRERVSGTYGGLIFCGSVEEGNEIIEDMREVVSREISEDIPVALKRGCSEYELAYPGFSKVEQNDAGVQYNEEWRKFEDIVDSSYNFTKNELFVETNNSSVITPKDAQVMHVWIKYAATIGDLSYRVISGFNVEPFSHLNRPAQFQSAGGQ